mmetsp:Transcript_31328/g.54381  ORF Transcript_31328/g.54381 Transcript_31328/m.54381 type:complete len:207 (-) Transcript_31328:253-873(-)
MLIIISACIVDCHHQLLILILLLLLSARHVLSCLQPPTFTATWPPCAGHMRECPCLAQGQHTPSCLVWWIDCFLGEIHVAPKFRRQQLPALNMPINLKKCWIYFLLDFHSSMDTPFYAYLNRDGGIAPEATRGLRTAWAQMHTEQWQLFSQNISGAEAGYVHIAPAKEIIFTISVGELTLVRIPDAEQQLVDNDRCSRTHLFRDGK